MDAAQSHSIGYTAIQQVSEWYMNCMILFWIKLYYDSITIQKILCTATIFWCREAHWLSCTSTPEVCNKLNYLPSYQNLSLVAGLLTQQSVCSLRKDAASKSDHTVSNYKAMAKNGEQCGSCCGLIIEALSWHLPGVTQHNHRDTCHSIPVSQPMFELDTSTVEVMGVASKATCQVDLANDWARDKQF